MTATTAITYIMHQCTTAAQLCGARHRGLTKPQWGHGTEGVNSHSKNTCIHLPVSAVATLARGLITNHNNGCMSL